MKNANWLFSRLKAMSFVEILHRVKIKLLNERNKFKYRNHIKIYDVLDVDIDMQMVEKNLISMFNTPSIDNIETLNYCNIFNSEVMLKEVVNWHKGMFEDWNKSISSYDISTRNTDSIGDIRYTWELNRMHFAPYIAMLYLKEGKEKYIKLLESYFEDWVDNNRICEGVNWVSSMEIAIRSYQWLIVLFLIKDANKKDFKVKICRSILASIKYVMENLSLYSSANNHLIVESAISSIVGYCFKDVYKQNWFDKGSKRLQKEIIKQFYSDGVNKEQALHYQAFVIDMMLHYNFIMKNLNKKTIEDGLIKKSVEFIYNIGAAHNYTDFGDSDDARIINLTNRVYNYYDYILALASKYYKVEFTSNHNKYAEVSLLSPDIMLSDKFNDMEYKLYEKGGYFLVNNKANNILFDFGKLGFGSLAAHGHADALMFLYCYKGHEFLIDSGTYIYNINKEKRNYYRSTEAHNTLSYMKKNQSEILGPFLWGKKCESKIDNFYENNEEVTIEASHNGYSPYIHKRVFKYLKNSNDLYIRDYFDTEAELNFILDPRVTIKKVDDCIYELNNNEVVYLYIEGDSMIESTFVSKYFMTEEKTYKINVKYEFIKEHTTIISPDLETIKKYISQERGL